MISKELFEAVTNIKSDRLFYSSDGYVSTDMAGTENKINIYELAHKCKEWAKSKEFIIHSSATQKIEYTAIAQHFDLNKFYYGQNQFYALSEYEAIFKACDYILKELSNK